MKRISRFWAVSAAITAGLAMFVIAPERCFAANFQVNHTGDGGDAAADGVCEVTAAMGDCTLRAALDEANDFNDTDTISFDASVFPAGGGTTIHTASELLLEAPVTITGPGIESLTVNNDGSSRVFRINHNGFNVPAGPHAISGMTITGGAGGIHVEHIEDDVVLDSLAVTGNTAATNEGGGIRIGTTEVFGSVLIRRSTIEGNASTQEGGGIANMAPSGDVTIEDSTIAGNSTVSQQGGGIHNDDGGFLTIRRCVIRGNSGGSGGGIHQRGGSSLVIEKSTISDNESSAFGGGLRNSADGSTVTITNSTISGNRAELDGGGISNNSNLANTVTLVNVTITGNTADVDGSGDGNGGGIHNDVGVADTNIIELSNTIIAGNADGSAGAEAPDCEAADGGGAVQSIGNNLIGEIQGCSDQDFDEAAKNDQIGASTNGGVIDPLLAALDPADGGDPAAGRAAAVHVPLNGSPAIDGVDATITAAPADDQNGTSRPQGPSADIGAVEAACGDGEAQGAEECDDGDTTSGDGCSATCEIESGGTTGGTTGGTGGDDGGGCSLIR